jgi:hypothetical protein
MNFQMLGSAKNQNLVIGVLNEDTVSIPAGSPVCYKMSGTNDGLGVVLPAQAGAGASSAICGIVPVSIAVGEKGTAVAYGIIYNAKLVLQTRAATTDSFASLASIAKFSLLLVDSAGNRMQSAASVAQTGYLPHAFIAQTVASQASSASGAVTSAFSTATAVYTTVKAFVRMM